MYFLGFGFALCGSDPYKDHYHDVSAKSRLSSPGVFRFDNVNIFQLRFDGKGRQQLANRSYYVLRSISELFEFFLDEVFC